MAKKVVIASACRTAIGTMGGSLSTTPAAELGAIVIKEAVKRAGIKPEDVEKKEYKLIATKAIAPSKEEIERNSRSKSAKLRGIEKVG